MNTDIPVNCLKAALISLIASMLMLMLGCAAVCRTADPKQHLAVIAYTVLFLGSAASGYVSARLQKERCLICGAVSGAIYGGVLLIVSAFLRNERSISFGYAVIAFAAIIVISLVFGKLGAPRSPSPARRRRELRRKYMQG